MRSTASDALWCTMLISTFPSPPAGLRTAWFRWNLWLRTGSSPTKKSECSTVLSLKKWKCNLLTQVVFSSDSKTVTRQVLSLKAKHCRLILSLFSSLLFKWCTMNPNRRISSILHQILAIPHQTALYHNWALAWFGCPNLRSKLARYTCTMSLSLVSVVNMHVQIGLMSIYFVHQIRIVPLQVPTSIILNPASTIIFNAVILYWIKEAIFFGRPDHVWIV